MLQQDSTIENVKYEVLLQVAKHAYRGDLEEVKEQLPYEMIPGSQALFRCCIYKEREIIRQRIRMAEGKSPVAGNTNRNTIHVITSACEGCPILLSCLCKYDKETFSGISRKHVNYSLTNGSHGTLGEIYGPRSHNRFYWTMYC